ncbi:MAG: gamma-glutamyltransferase, partial [Micromonosporaceae bacterium]|nr:gamma-glutamyltransferase [Micromonosporaceae bacterium]
MPAGIAAGHPITADVGLRLIEAGGSAADSAAGAVLASCVAETVLTGLGGGGFATYFNARTRTVTCLDFFCTVPGLDLPSARAASWSTTPVDISFGRVPLRFSIGGGTIAVPGVPAGIGALHRRWGRLPWQDVVAPAIQLAVDGVPLPGAHAATLAAIAPAMLPDEGSAGYAPTGRLLLGGEVLHHPGLAEAMTVLAEQGPAAWYTGTLGSRIVETVRSAGGVLSPTDLAAYQVRQVPV